jgi:hypothetical protein
MTIVFKNEGILLFGPDAFLRLYSYMLQIDASLSAICNFINLHLTYRPTDLLTMKRKKQEGLGS